MAKKKQQNIDGKLAIGICVDGLSMRVACLLKRKDGIHIIDAQNVALAGVIDSAESVSAQAEGLGLECLAGESYDDEDAGFLDLTADLEEAESTIKVNSDGQLSEKHKNPADDSELQINFGEDSLDGDDDGNAEAMPIDLEFLLESPENSPLEVEDIDDISENTNFEMLDSTELEAETDELAIDITTLDLEEDSDSDLMPEFEEDSLDISTLDMSDELKVDSFREAKEMTSKGDNASILMNVLNRYPANNIEIAISLPEPQIYYSYFDTDWGLKGRKLKSKISDELFKERPDSEAIKQDAINTLQLSDGNLMAVVREQEVGILNLLGALRLTAEKRLPKISVVESVEISLTNVVRHNYNFEDDEITVIVFIGNDFSRLIFMRGNELYHISPIIGEGIDSFLVFGHPLKELGNTIQSRLLLEQDDLNLPTVNNLILSGDACHSEIKNMLSSWFTEDIRIEELHYSNMQINHANSAILKNLPVVPAAVGAAMRVLEPSNKTLYHVDLLPGKIKESQKVFKLGPVGWILLGLIPAMTFYTTTRVSEMDAESKLLATQYQYKKIELQGLQDVQAMVDAASKKLSYYQNTFGVLDSMVVGTETWSTFLHMMSANAKKTGGIWITDLNFTDSYKANIKGYSLFRNKIPPFTESLKTAELTQVQVQEIRGRTIYYFEITAQVPLKD